MRSLDPNMEALKLIDKFAVIATAPGKGCDFVSRFFAPAKGVPEDPVTGSAHCTLIPYWAARLGKNQLRARQISQRGGELFCELRDDRVEIAGCGALACSRSPCNTNSGGEIFPAFVLCHRKNVEKLATRSPRDRDVNGGPMPEEIWNRRTGTKVSIAERDRFERTVLPHLKATYNLARWLTRNEHDAEDVVQEAFLRALRSFETFQIGRDVRAWFLTIVRNTCCTWLRQNRPREPMT